MTILRRVRGVVGTAFLWAIAWSVVLVPPAVYGWWHRESEYFDWLPLAIVGRTILLVAEWGALHGLLFALIVAVVAARNGGHMTLARFSLWGALAGMLVPVIFGSAWWWMLLPIDGPLTFVAIAASGMFGGALGAGTFKLARPAPELLITGPHESDDG